MSSENKDTIPFDKRKKPEHKNRNIALTVGSIIILILSAITFIFIPAMTDSSSNDKLPAFGSYNKKPIKYEQNSYFANMVQQYAENAKNSGQQIDASAYYYIFSSAFNSTVINFAATDEVQNSGYNVPDSQVDRSILPYFYDTNGVYSPKIFNDTPDSTKVTLRKSAYENLTYMRFIEDYFGSTNAQNTSAPSDMYGLKTSSKELPFIKEMATNERSFELATFPTADYPLEEAIAFGKENPDLFNKYNLSVITVDTEATAKSVLAQITKGEVTFDDAVAEFSTKSYSGDNGKLTSSFKYQIKSITTSDEDLTAITSLEPEETSGIIKTANGKYSIFQSNSTFTAPDFTEENTALVVKSYMSSYEVGKIEDYYTGVANDFITAASINGFDEACTSFGIEKADVTPFTLNYGNSPLLSSVPSDSIASLSGAETNENFLKVAFGLKEGEISTPIVLGKNVLVLKLTGKSVADESRLSVLDYMYPYYSSQNDQGSLQTFYMGSKKLKNDFMNVYLKYFLN